MSVVLPADILTPVLCYLAITEGAELGIESFLLESVVRGETAGRYSYIGASELNFRSRSLETDEILDPKSIIRSGDEFDIKGDPLINLENVLADYDFITVDGCPAFTGETKLTRSQVSKLIELLIRWCYRIRII